MPPALVRHGKVAANLEVYTDTELALLLIEPHPRDEPGGVHAQCRLKDLLGDHFDLSASLLRRSAHFDHHLLTTSPSDRLAALPMKRDRGGKIKATRSGPDYPLGI